MFLPMTTLINCTNLGYCNFISTVGGIYTVIRSKASSSVDELGDHYILIGPYKELCARQEVETFELPSGTPLAIAVQKLRDRGFKVGVER